MSKLGKWIVGILVGLVISGGIALSICYIAIPERTKCAIDIVVGYLNTPYGLGCGITITGSMVIFLFSKYLIKYAIANSKYGKGELEKVKDQVKEYKDKALELKEKGEKLDIVVKDYLSDFNTRLDLLSNYLAKVCETSPNAKIKALGNDLVSGYATKKEELSKELDKINSDYKSYVAENKSIDELFAKLEELERKVLSYEREESTND